MVFQPQAHLVVAPGVLVQKTILQCLHHTTWRRKLGSAAMILRLIS